MQSPANKRALDGYYCTAQERDSYISLRFRLDPEHLDQMFGSEPRYWRMRLGGITERVAARDVPNRFHRWMQRSLLGIEWTR